jgi:hypothetical protein
MTRKATQSSFQPSDDIRVDYALIASSLAAGVFALIYLVLVLTRLDAHATRQTRRVVMSVWERGKVQPSPQVFAFA